MLDNTIRILVVDDDPGLLAVLECGLTQHRDYWVKAVDNAQRALRELESGGWDLVITDYLLNHPEIDGIGLLRAARALPQPPLVIIITAFASLQITLEWINLGAHNFLTKPFQMDELYLVVRNAVEMVRLERENRALREQVSALAGESDELSRQQQELLEQMRRLEYEGGSAEVGKAAPNASLSTVQAMELRRRRLREKMAAYLRAGETLHQKIDRQRHQIQEILNPPPAG